jgi:predicted transcriptional regulator of viral defense system
MDQYGFITAENLRSLGGDPVRLRQWCQRGGIERVGHGIYRFNQIPPSPNDPYMLATLWPSGRGVLSHDTALELYELCDINPDKIHLTLPPAYRYRPRREDRQRYIVHHEGLADNEIVWHEGIRIVTPGVAILQGINTRVPAHLIRQAIETTRRLGRAPKATLGDLERRLEERR